MVLIFDGACVGSRHIKHTFLTSSPSFHSLSSLRSVCGSNCPCLSLLAALALRDDTLSSRLSAVTHCPSCQAALVRTHSLALSPAHPPASTGGWVWRGWGWGGVEGEGCFPIVSLAAETARPAEPDTPLQFLPSSAGQLALPLRERAREGRGE